MEVTFYSVQKSLILPPGGLILLLLLGFLLVRGVLGRVLLLIGISIFTLMSLPPVAGHLMAGLETYPALRPQALADTGADGILILGGGRYSWAPEYGGDTVGPRTLERLRYGAFLHRHTGLPVYVTGGSPAPERPPTARLMEKVLEQEFAIPVAGVEDRSLTTAENAIYSAEMLHRDGIRRVFLVTHAWHLPRAIWSFERVGMAVTPAPTYFGHREGSRDKGYGTSLPSAKAFMASYYALHEYSGQLWYRLKDKMGKGREGPFEASP